MAQPTITAYFNVRKRVKPAEDHKINGDKDALLVNEDKANFVKTINEELQITKDGKDCNEQNCETDGIVPNKIISKTRKVHRVISNTSRRKQNSTVNEEGRHVTPPTTPTKIQNRMDKVIVKSKDVTMNAMKLKLGRSARLSELKASISRFGELQNKLKETEEKTAICMSNCVPSPKLQNFKAINLEVQLSPQKILSPEKFYLSPKKDLTARKNLLGLLSPTKNAVALFPESPSKKIELETSKPALKLPLKYCSIAEMFRAIDTVVQLLYNRKETITLSRLKPAVENLTKKNLSNRHLAQIKKIYPEAFKFHQEKLRVFGSGKKEEKWELVITPQIEGSDNLNSDTLLARRRVLHNKLLDKVKEYHSEFLMSLEPPMTLPKNEIKRWHPEFNIEMIPDIEEDSLPEPPAEIKITSGQEVLEKAKEMFGCNNKMEQALERLKAEKEAKGPEAVPENTPVPSILKGIPKHLLEKVRQRQAAKALISMTRSADKEKELKIYSRLPELARLTKNIFVSEKKSVLKLDDVVEKLGNCYRISLTVTEMEEHIKLLVKELPDWLVLHQALNKTWFLKQINRNADLNEMRNKLETIVKEKSNQCNP